MRVAAGVRTASLLERCSFPPPVHQSPSPGWAGGLEPSWTGTAQGGHRRSRRTDSSFASQRSEISDKLRKEAPRVEVNVGPTHWSAALLEARRREGKGGQRGGGRAACDSRYPHGTPEGWRGLLREEVDNAKELSVMQMWWQEECSWVSSGSALGERGRVSSGMLLLQPPGLYWGSLSHGQQKEGQEGERGRSGSLCWFG